MSTSSTSFPEEQARCQCLLWPKECPANIVQDRLTMSSVGEALRCHLSTLSGEASVRELAGKAQLGAGGHCLCLTLSCDSWVRTAWAPPLLALRVWKAKPQTIQVLHWNLRMLLYMEKESWQMGSS